MGEKLGIIQKYSSEIINIENKLKDLQNSRVYEISGAKTDGYLATNANQLKKMFNELLLKIDNQEPSIIDELNEAFGQVSKSGNSFLGIAEE